MADYMSAHRTSYFRVTDETAYADLCKGLIGVDEFFSEEKPEGLYHGFGGFQTAQYTTPPSQHPNIIKRLAENKPICTLTHTSPPYANEDTCTFNPLTDEELKNIDEFDDLYDENGKCIYSRWDDIADLDDKDSFIPKLQKILHPDDAFVYIEAGHEKLRYIEGSAVVATRDNMRYTSLDGIINSSIKEFLGENASVKYTY